MAQSCSTSPGAPPDSDPIPSGSPALGWSRSRQGRGWRESRLPRKNVDDRAVAARRLTPALRRRWPAKLRAFLISRYRASGRAQGHSKKALGGEEDGIETVLGQGLANGRERSRQRPRQAQDRVA